MFKYVPIKRIDILEKRQIRFTQPFDWNDPFEAQINIKSDNSKITKYNEILNTFFVSLSLSKTKNDILMWSHYTENHQGFLIEFNKTSDFIKNKKSLLIKIPYTKIRYNITYSEAYNILEKLYNYLHGVIKLSREDKLKVSLIFSKNEEWSYENEYRLISLPEYATKIKSKRTNKNIKMDYKEPQTYRNLSVRYGKVESDNLCLFKFDPKAIKSIFLGCDINSFEARKINKILMEEDYEHVELFRAELDSSEYKLNYKQKNHVDLLTIKELMKYNKQKRARSFA